MKTKMSLKHINRQNMLLISIVSLILGIIQVFAPVFFMDFIDYIVGVGFLVVGVYNIALHFKHSQNEAIPDSLGRGVILSLLGVYFLYNRGFVLGIMAMVFGIQIITNSVLGLQVSIEAKRKGFDKWIWLLILSLIDLILGVIVLFFPFSSTLVLIFYTGLFMMISAISNIVMLLINKLSGKNNDTN